MAGLGFGLGFHGMSQPANRHRRPINPTVRVRLVPVLPGSDAARKFDAALLTLMRWGEESARLDAAQRTKISP